MLRSNFVDSDVKDTARSLASLLTVLRSAAIFYYERDSRLTWLARALDDIRFDEILREQSGGVDIPTAARSAVVDFCQGNLNVRTLGGRLCTVFRRQQMDFCPRPVPATRRPREDRDSEEDDEQPSSSTAVVKRPRMAITSTGGDGEDTSGASSDTERLDVNEVSDDAVDRPRDAPRLGIYRLDVFWSALYDRLRQLTLVKDSTNDGYDVRIEFVRQFKMDLRAGLTGMCLPLRVGNTSAGSSGNLATETDCIKTLAQFGQLNKCMVSSNAMMLDIDPSAPVGSAATTEYPVYLFGSNCISVRPDATEEQGGHAVPPTVFDDEEDVRNFMTKLILYSDGTFVSDSDGCRTAAVESGTVTMTSLSKTGVSLQFAFAMPDSRFYTANVFYINGGDTCSTDFQYDRRYLSNACQCENRLSHWRLAVSVAAFDGDNLDARPGSGLSDFVVNVVRAFHVSKQERGTTPLFVNQFTGTLLVHYLYDSVPSPDGCYIHRWLGYHNDVRDWRAETPVSTIELLSRVPQLFIVLRPLVSETATASNGPGIFVKYKTYGDIVQKHVLLSWECLREGYSQKRKAVAYKSQNNYWIFGATDDDSYERYQKWDGGEDAADDADGAGPSRAHTNEIYKDNDEGDDTEAYETDSENGRDTPLHHSSSVNDPNNSVEEFFNRAFNAPSRLYVHVGVLSKLGFNPTAVASGRLVAATTFTHTDRDTGYTCTVICSSPTVFIDETSQLPFETQDTIRSFQVLKFSGALYGVLQKYRDALVSEVSDAISYEYKDLNEFWPGVRAIALSFTCRVLENVHFVLFTATDGNESLRRLTNDGLSRLNRSNKDAQNEILPPPVLYTLQKVCQTRVNMI